MVCYNLNMNLDEFKIKLEENGIVVEKKMLKDFDTYANLLIEWNNKFNLTSIRDYNEIVEKHFFDSLIPLFNIDICGKVADIGTGAGFPGIPLKIVRKNLKMYLIESNSKKCMFLNEVINRLDLKDIYVINKRSEDLEYREYFDFVISRAVARLNILSELCIPLVKVNGMFIAMKSSKAQEEISEASNAIKLLGARLENKYIYEDDLLRVNIAYKKISKTLDKYPRTYSKIKKSPL